MEHNEVNNDRPHSWGICEFCGILCNEYWDAREILEIHTPVQYGIIVSQTMGAWRVMCCDCFEDKGTTKDGHAFRHIYLKECYSVVE